LIGFGRVFGYPKAVRTGNLKIGRITQTQQREERGPQVVEIQSILVQDNQNVKTFKIGEEFSC
jgi:hypothetical protein